MLALILPSLGVWIASSIMALQGGPRQWAVAAGALCFPIVPGFWAWAARRARGRAPRWGSLFDLALRTIVVNLGLLATLFAFWPQATLVAVSTRGDWFLDDLRAPWAGTARMAVLDVAEGLAWVHGRFAPNRFAESAPQTPVAVPTTPVAGPVAVAPAPVPPKAPPRAKPQPLPGATRPKPAPVVPARTPIPARPAPAVERAGRTVKNVPTAPAERDDARATEAASESEALVLTNKQGALRWQEGGELPKAGLTVVPSAPVPSRPSSQGNLPTDVAPPPPQRTGPLRWPLPGGPHVGAQAVPDASTRSVKALAKWIAAYSDDPKLRLRVLHDWMATHIAYDDTGQFADPPPPYMPEQVLETRTALCDGFARVFGGVAQALGYETAYVVGRTRAPEGDLSPLGHAWNAVKIDGAWYLVDVTWDVRRWTSGKTQPFSTAYLFAPPEVFRITHMPDDPVWQLARTQIGLAAFLRQPMSKPSFHANGLTLIEPRRPHINARSQVQVKLQNPQRRYLTLTLEPKKSDSRKPGHRPCAPPTSSEQPTLQCPVPRHGEYVLGLWVGSRATGTRVMAARWVVVSL